MLTLSVKHFERLTPMKIAQNFFVTFAEKLKEKRITAT